MKTRMLTNAAAVALVIVSLLAIAVAVAIIPAKAQEGAGSPTSAASPIDEALLQEAAQNSQPYIVSGEMVTAAGTGLRVVPATEFRRTFGAGNSAGWFENGYIRATTDDGTWNEFIAPVRLPDGSLIKNMTAFIYDNSGVSMVDVWFIKSDYMNANLIYVPAHVNSTSTDTQIRPYTYTFPYNERVDNSRYMYYILTRIYRVSQRLYSVNLEFSYEIHMPSLVNNICNPQAHTVESEPNEGRAQANLICTGLPVKGYPNDSYPNPELDWYTFEWNGQGSLQVDLTDFVIDGQLILYKGNTELGKDFSKTNLQVTHPGAGPGTYYILVAAGVSRPDPGVDYTLNVTIK